MILKVKGDKKEAIQKNLECFPLWRQRATLVGWSLEQHLDNEVSSR